LVYKQASNSHSIPRNGHCSRSILGQHCSIHSFIAPTFPALPSVRPKLELNPIIVLTWLFRSSEGGATCRQILFYTAIVSWVLCGLLVIYAACLAIMVCIPRPPPILGLDPELDAEVPVNAQARHIIHSSIDSHTGLVEPNAGKQPYAVWPSPDTRHQTIYTTAAGDTTNVPLSLGMAHNSVPMSHRIICLGEMGNAVYRPRASHGPYGLQMKARPSPSSSPYTEPIPQARTPDTNFNVIPSALASSSVVFSMQDLQLCLHLRLLLSSIRTQRPQRR